MTTATAGISCAENGGLLCQTLTLSHNGVYAHGPVPDTSTFTGATGAITAKPANESGTRLAVTITHTS
jgi:hypothetical protein